MGEAFSVPLSEAALRLLGDQMGERGKSPLFFPVARASRCQT